MKKSVLLLCLSLMLTGCLNKENVPSAEKNEKYENYMELIIDNSKQVSSDIPFDWNFNMVESSEKYVYEIVISNPRIEMTDIQMIAADITEIRENVLAPSIGIFEEQSYNMVPNQVNPELGYFEGIGLNGETSKPSFVLNCLVVYKDRKHVDNYIYFIINADIADFQEKEVEVDE